METFICQACGDRCSVGPTALDQERLHRKVCGACEDSVAATQLRAVGSLDGEMNIVYPRKDAPLFHVIAKAPPGAAFTVGDHFDVCSVCKEHGVTFEQFHDFMLKDHS